MSKNDPEIKDNFSAGKENLHEHSNSSVKNTSEDKIESSFEIASSIPKIDDQQLSPSQRLVTDQLVLKRSLRAIHVAVFADAVTGTILQPNFPLMVLPGAHEDTFPSTEPFEFNAATYFIPMTYLVGVAIASTGIGAISDRFGRKPCMMLSTVGSTVGSIAKWLLRKSFWGFCAANFVNGLFSASVPVALAYVGDAIASRAEKDEEIAVLIGLSVVGASGGGICAILMESQGLFAPLWIGVGLMAFASVLVIFFMVEPSREYKLVGKDEDDEEDEKEHAPEELNVRVFVNIIAGALGDNFGSAGLLPLCLSPLAFQTYYSDFIEVGLEPIMSEIAYKWISVMVALMVIPSTIISPPLFNKIGVAGSCVMGNIITAVVTIALLYIATAAPPTKPWFIFFTLVLYMGFPFTVISQITTGPMLDIISPADKRGFVQGMNISVMNFGGALSPFLLGALADATSKAVAIWACIGISLFAAVVNVPLMFIEGLGPAKKKVPLSRRPAKWEDDELIERALKGEWIPAEQLDNINEKRFEKSRPFLVVRYGKYHDEKRELKELRSRARDDYNFFLRKNAVHLNEIRRSRRDGTLNDVIAKYNASLGNIAPEDEASTYEELGTWFADYVKDGGYKAHLGQAVMKQMIMSAFPPIIKSDEELTALNVETILLKEEKLLRQFVDLENAGFDDGEYTLSRVLNAGRGNSLMSSARTASTMS